MTEQLSAQLALLPATLGAHVQLSLLALLLGAAIGLPLSVAVVRQPRLARPALTAVAVIQTIPSLALLALSVPVLAGVAALAGRVGVQVSVLGFLPAVGALTLYSLLPIVRNTVTGLNDVDPALIEAARAVGMTDAQVLREVQLPLATPVILAGLRTAAVWVVGIATLATPVGQTCLGDHIFAGLQTRNHVAVVVGCVAAAALAIGLDGLLAWVERRRGPAIWVAAAVAVLGIGVPSLGGRSDRAAVVVGSKGFTESYILAALLEQRLEAAGFAVERRDGLGSTVIFDALAAGDVDVYVDYSGTLWANQLGRGDALGSAEVQEVLGDWLAEEYGISLIGALGFENAYAIAVRRADAEAHGWRSVGDLNPAGKLVMGGDYEFFDRPEWAAVRDTYRLEFAALRRFDPTFLYEAAGRGEADAISAFTTDGRIAAYDLVTLADPDRALPPYDAVILISADAPAGVDRALDVLVGGIDAEAMRRANHLVDGEGTPVEEAARKLGMRIGD